MKTRAELKAMAKEQIKGNIGILFVCSLIFTAICGGLGFIPVIGAIGSFIITPAFALGLATIYIGVSKGKKAEVGDLFSGFQNFGNAFLANLLMSIFIFLWSLLLIVPGIIKAISYSMTFYVLAEHPEMSGKEAIDESKKIMEGHKWEYFVLCLSFILWFLLGSITLGIAYIYVAPYMSTTITNFYHEIKNADEVVKNGTYQEPVAEA
ncbi:MAG: DUF975 family protein [Lachnospiraceae bacterium]|nr:DUF975 family protein [Lachnospiraceae bacterium]